jgi:16S rRNA (cytidine1402-2'-O)-methyltransferase
VSNPRNKPDDKQGTLWVVATPIGNLGDMSSRAVEVLKQVQVIAAEDTRRTGTLLNHFGVDTPMLSCHEHNEVARVDELMGRLEGGEDVALVSDAGTPLISDPGFPLVREARARGIRVSPVPGPSALTAALCVAGLPTDRLLFEGFLPFRREARRKHLARLAGEQRTMVFYESTHRITEMLADCAEILGPERPAVVARELTKTFESVTSGTLSELAAALANGDEPAKGEFVVLIGTHPAADPDAVVSDEARRVLEILAADLAPSQAAKLAAAITGAKRQRLYELIAESPKKTDKKQ